MHTSIFFKMNYSAQIVNDGDFNGFVPVNEQLHDLHETSVGLIVLRLRLNSKKTMRCLKRGKLFTTDLRKSSVERERLLGSFSSATLSLDMEVLDPVHGKNYYEN